MKRTPSEEAAWRMHYPEPGDRRRALHDNADAPLREKLDRIQAKIEKLQHHYAITLFEIGCLCNEICDDLKRAHGGSKYGTYAMEVLQEYFPHDDGLIYRAMKLAETYTVEEIEAVMSLCKDDGEPFGIHDLILLGRVDDRVKRQELIGKAVANAWRAWEIKEAVDAAVGVQLKPKSQIPGRPLGIPRDFNDLVYQQEVAARNFVNRAKSVWEVEANSILGKLSEMAQDDFTTERAMKLKVLADLLDDLAQEAREQADAARKGYDLVSSSIERRKAQQSQGESAEKQAETSTENALPKTPGVVKKSPATREGQAGVRNPRSVKL